MFYYIIIFNSFTDSMEREEGTLRKGGFRSITRQFFTKLGIEGGEEGEKIYIIH